MPPPVMEAKDRRCKREIANGSAAEAAVQYQLLKADVYGGIVTEEE